MQEINSSSNSHIKELKSLKDRKKREEMRLFFIEGLRFVQEALGVNAQIVDLYISEEFIYKNETFFDEKIRSLGCNKYLLPNKLFKEVSDTETPQGILGVIKMREIELVEILDESNFLILLDSLQDPGNMGTIIRTAHAGGVDGIILSKGCVDIYNPKTLRSTMGSIFSLPVIAIKDIEVSIKLLRERGFQIVVTDINTTKKAYEFDFKPKTVLVIGNEANGISKEILELSDSSVSIPMPGKAESLNASIAAGILIYEVGRQRQS